MRISDKVQRVLAGEHISAEELAYMVAESAVTRLRHCNRRYFNWLFLLEGTSLVDMQHVFVVEIGRGSNRMTEEHESCEGQGCRACGWVGSVSRAVQDATAEAIA